MTDADYDVISRALVDALGGRTPWVLLWSADDNDEGMMSSVSPRELPEMLCDHLLRLLRGKLLEPHVLAREH